MLARVSDAEVSGTPYDVAILDQDVPALDSDRPTALVTGTVPMIILTSGDRTHELHKTPLIGHALYLPKPIRRALLYDRLVAVLRANPESFDNRDDRRSSHTDAPKALRGRILLVEDNPVNQAVATHMLEYLGCCVQAVSNGREAIEAVQHSPFDLVLMDCEMPDIDGFEATKIIRTQEAATASQPLPLVALTAHASEDYEAACLAAGMDAYLSKPFTLENVYTVLSAWLSQPPESPPLSSHTRQPHLPPG